MVIPLIEHCNGNTMYGLDDGERFMMDNDEWQSLQLPPFPSEQGHQGVAEAPASQFSLFAVSKPWQTY
eukprot:11600968-Ditylum_brightwellii.AAC.1